MSDVKGLEITDVLGLSQPLTKLIDTVSGGIGTLYKPVHLKRMAKAKAEEIKLISEAIVDNSNLPINYQHGNVGIDSTDVQNLMLRTQQRSLQEEMKKQQNMDSVVANAAEELQGKEQVSETPVNEDWTTRFISIAKDISSEDMQHIWGKILAGEVANPGSFSLRTLETIRNLSQVEAMTFQKIIPYVVRASRDYVISSESNIYEKYGVSFSDFMLLDECGLVVSHSSLSFTTTLAEGIAFMYNDGYCATLSENNGTTPKVSFGIYLLTNAGKELYQILSHEPNKEYFLDFVEHVFKKCSNLSINVYKVTEIVDSRIQHENTIVCEFCKKKGTIR